MDLISTGKDCNQWQRWNQQISTVVLTSRTWFQTQPVFIQSDQTNEWVCEMMQ